MMGCQIIINTVPKSCYSYEHAMQLIKLCQPSASLLILYLTRSDAMKMHAFVQNKYAGDVELEIYDEDCSTTADPTEEIPTYSSSRWEIRKENSVSS